jgi:hypothetical protein
MNEQLISFETAKLAKEKGFNWKCYQAYDWVSGFPGNTHTGYNNWNKFGDGKASAPTQSLLQKWLRDTHKIHISLDYWTVEDLDSGELQVSWNYEITRFGASFNERGSNLSSYEQALEEGLKKSLELL